MKRNSLRYAKRPCSGRVYSAGHVRYRAVGVMSVGVPDGKWTIETEADQGLDAELLILNMPAPQTLKPIWRKQGAYSGYVRPPAGPVLWVADNRQKRSTENGRGAHIHATAAFSREYLERSAVHLAKEVGEGVGGSETLQRQEPGQPEQSKALMQPLRRDFVSRDELAEYLRREFHHAAARDPEISPWPGGRREAERRLAQIDPRRYAATRNDLGGTVTRLSPYIRHGILSLSEVRARAVAIAGTARAIPKFIAELAWRDYWQRLYHAWGAGVGLDREEYKTGWTAAEYQPELPPDVREGATGLACIDGFSNELRATGYLHNHARMWLAAYLVHWRRVRWQAGARWFLLHLLDGDPASNNLSWQWVASTFSHKPYIFNRENLEKYTGGRYCRECKAGCPFDASYDSLSERLFQIGGRA